jgi:hypothetical protein
VRLAQGAIPDRPLVVFVIPPDVGHRNHRVIDTTSGSASLAKRQFQNDLDNLRDLMEARAL